MQDLDKEQMISTLRKEEASLTETETGKELEIEKALPLWVPEKTASTLELDNVKLIPFLL